VQNYSGQNSFGALEHMTAIGDCRAWDSESRTYIWVVWVRGWGGGTASFTVDWPGL
jgi:hypothetical protein